MTCRILSIFSLMVVASMALPLNFQISTEYINLICKRAQQMVDNKYLPEWAMKDFCSLSDEDKGKVATFVNNFHSNAYSVPKNNVELVKLLKEEAPAAGNVYESVYNKAKDMVGTLPQNIQDLWEAKNFEMVRVDRVQWFETVMKEAKAFVKDVEAISDDDWAKIRVAFPEYENFWKSSKVVALRTLIKSLPDNFTTDTETMQKVFNMSVGELLPKPTSA